MFVTNTTRYLMQPQKSNCIPELESQLGNRDPYHHQPNGFLVTSEDLDEKNRASKKE